MELTIEKSLALTKIEGYYDLIPKSIKELDISIPSSFTENIFSSKATLCQLINTWIRKSSDNSSIFTHLINDDQYIENFSKEFFGWSTCLMTIKQGRKIYDRSGKTDITARIFKKALSKFEETFPKISQNNNEKLFGGKTGPIRVFCFDHSSIKNYQYNEWFYQDGKLLDETGISKFYSAAIKHLLKPHKSELLIKALEIETSKKVTGIIKELFENTDKHAINDFGVKANIPLNPNMRGVFMEIHKGNKNELLSKTEIGDPLNNYFRNPNLFKNDSQLKTFIEISVIDSGPGFAQRRTGKALEEMNYHTEKQCVIECLTKYDTGVSKRGLKRVASYLGSNGGFLRLRTGRICIYWDFLLHKYLPYEHETQYAEFIAAKSKFFDWYGSDRELTKLNEAAGSLVTVFFPLD